MKLGKNCNLDGFIETVYVQLVLLFICTQRGLANIYWEVHSQPVVFGESVKLYCNTSSVQDECKDCTRRWYGGKIEDLLSFNSLTVDHSKYETAEDSNGFSLIIKHFSEEDVNIYSCTFGFFYDKKILRLPSDFEIQPTNDTIHITQFINSSSVMNVRVDFKKVHPPPRCTVVLNGDNLTSQLTQEGIFYRVIVDFQHNLIPNHCVHTIQLNCVIGTRNILLNLISTCSVENSVKDEKKEIVRVIIVVWILLLAGIMAIIIIHKRCCAVTTSKVFRIVDQCGIFAKSKQKGEKEKELKLMEPGSLDEERKMSSADELTSD